MTTTLEVVLPEGGSSDLMSFDRDQVCHSVLDHDERWAASTLEVEDLVG